MGFKQIEKILRELLLRFKSKLDFDIIERIYILINAGEYGIALEEFNNMLYEYEISITNVDYNDIIKLCEMMSMNSDEWKFLKELIK